MNPGYSDRILVISLMTLVGTVLGSLPAHRTTLASLVLAVLATLAIQAKFSNGLLALVTTFLLAALGPGRSLIARAQCVAWVALTTSITGIISWVVAGQSLTDLPAWIRGSLELTSGYSDAMFRATAAPSDYILFAAVTLVVVVLVVLRIRGPKPLVIRGRVMLLLVPALVTAWCIVVALRVGFTRDDIWHAYQAFVILLAVILAVGVARAHWLGVIGASTAGLLAIGFYQPSYLQIIDPGTRVAQARELFNAVTSTDHREEMLKSSAAIVNASLNVPEPIARDLEGESVQVDPYDTAVVWSRALNWNPAPVFQIYAAYTPYLDQLNAKMLRSPDGPSAILKHQVRPVDGRNPLWDSPEYVLTEICGYAPTVSSEGWAVLLRDSWRCSHESQLLSTSHLEPGEVITVPDAPGKDWIVVASISAQESLTDRVGQWLFKPTSTLEVSTENDTYRVPRALSEGPLIVTVPQIAGWDESLGAVDAGSLSLSEPGSVTFSAIHIN